MSDLVDAAGIPLREHHRWLPPRVADFPPGKRVKDPLAVSEWRVHWAGSPCWFCERPTSGYLTRGELHHMCRTDRAFSFFWTCADCHRHSGDAVKSDSLFTLLKLKHQHDRANTLWLPLAIMLKRFLPEE